VIYVGGEILKFGRQQIDLLLGGGLEAFGVATVKKNDIFTSKAIHSTFLEPGIGYRFYPDKQRYAMITARLFYRFLNFDQDKKKRPDWECYRISVIHLYL
jgi:hypothetical protein